MSPESSAVAAIPAKLFIRTKADQQNARTGDCLKTEYEEIKHNTYPKSKATLSGIR